MTDHTYTLSIRIQTDRPLTDDELGILGDTNDGFQTEVDIALSDIEDLRVFSVEASGPEEVV